MSDHHLSVLLERTSRLTLAVELARAAALVVGALLAAALAAVVVDALLGLQTWGLIVIDLLFVGLLVAAGWYTVRAALRNLFNPRRVARQIEARLGIQDSRLINSVDLGQSASASSSRALVSRTVEHGEDLAANLSAVEGVDFRQMMKASAVTGAIVFGILVTYLGAPRLFAMVLPRFLDPTGDHPPFTLLDFEVTIEPETVYRGRPATISARLSGLESVDRANVVFVEGETRRPVPMTRGVDGKFVLPIEQADATREFYIDTPKGRSRRHTFEVLDVPFFERADATYDFPDYTGWPTATRELDPRGLRALEGTEITVTATGNLPLQSGRLELFEYGDEAPGETSPQPTRTIDLLPAAGDVVTVSGRFVLTRGGRYRLTLVGVNGAESLERLEGSLVSAPDRFPRVAILSPSPQVAAVENWKIPVEIQATDDVGVGRMLLMVAVNGWGPDPMPLELNAEQPTLAHAQHVFDLEQLGAQVGDIISYYVSAYDNHPSGTHFSDTPMHVIRVISLEEFVEFERQNFQMEQLVKEFEENRRRLEDLEHRRDEALEELADLQEKLEKGEQLSDEDLQRLEKLERLLKEFSENSDALAKQLEKQAERAQLYDLEQPYREKLRELAEQLRKQSDNADELMQRAAQMRREPGNSQSAEALRNAAQKFENDAQPFDQPTGESMENMEQDLEKLRKADDLLAQAERLRSAILQQRELADRMAQFRDRPKLTPDERRRAERMAKEQELLQQELEDAKTGLEKAAEAAREDLPKMSSAAATLCKALGDMQIGDDQRQAARSARAGDGDRASQSAESAAQKLESLLSDCPNPRGAAQSGDLDGCLSLPRPGLEQSLKQLAQGRSMPGMGQKGENGSGFTGSQARMSIFGPHNPTQGESDARSSQAREQSGPGGYGIGSGAQEGLLGAESINPAAREAAQTGVGGMRGVPVGYRDQAEAYFKRLAEEK